MFRVTESICREGDGEGRGVATVPVDDAGLCALGRQFAQIGRRNGFDYFLVSTFPKADKPEFAANSVFCNWPSALRDRYDASESFAASRLVTRLKQKILPFLTKDCVFASGQERAADIELAADFQECGLVNNLAFALHDAELAHYLIVFSGGARDARPPGDCQSLFRLPGGAGHLLRPDRTQGRSAREALRPRARMSALVGRWQEQRRDRHHPVDLQPHGRKLPQERDAQARFGQPHAGRRTGLSFPPALNAGLLAGGP